MAIDTAITTYSPIIWETGDTITAQKLNYVEQRVNNLLSNRFLLSWNENNSNYELKGRSYEELEEIKKSGNIILGVPDQDNYAIIYTAYYIGEQPDTSISGSPIRSTWAYLSYNISQGVFMTIRILTYVGNGIFESHALKEF